MKELRMADAAQAAETEQEAGTCGCATAAPGASGGACCTPSGQEAGACGCGGEDVGSEPCCGAAPAPPADPMERPGYAIRGFVDYFMDTPAGSVPSVATRLSPRDWWQTVLARLGVTRNDYRVAPGLYAVGEPGKDAPVVVTANYKLSFDAVRRELDGVDAWLLVLDTRGVNVWCAAGKRTFSTAEIVRRVRDVGLERIVEHRRLIVPQLGATGVSAREVKRGCGFAVKWGPVRARDLKHFLATGEADEAMRTVTFTFYDRLVLVPVELWLVRKLALLSLVAAVLLSGIGPEIFSFGAALSRGAMLAAACLAGAVAGCAGVPLLLPWLPGRMFALKGAALGAALGLVCLVPFWGGAGWLERAGMLLAATAVSSFYGMNFTGSTPYTSPTGVEREMRLFIPLQLAAGVLAVGAWVASPFLA